MNRFQHHLGSTPSKIVKLAMKRQTAAEIAISGMYGKDAR
jgi:hypothetical protein